LSNDRLKILIAVTGVSAITEAVLGPPSSSEISPKNSPGTTCAIVRLRRTTLASPSTTT
jgi:hypothetical protein